jgi:hypothetical protein
LQGMRFGHSTLLVLALWRTVPLLGMEDTSKDQFVGSDQCVACHADIAKMQLNSNHSKTLRRVQNLTELVKAVPLHFSDKTNAVEYRLEKSTSPNVVLDLVTARGERRERLNLLWGFGAGRKGITFLGRTEKGDYGQSRLSWYRKTNNLDITTGLETKVNDPHDALADWMTLPQRKRCFNCHTTRQEAIPENIDEKNAGIRCERCHGAGKKHIQEATLGKRSAGSAIGNPGKFTGIEQLYFCGACHGIPPGSTAVYTISRNMADARTVRYPAQRLVLSRCYNESQGNLKCTTCHNPHENLPQSAEHFDSKCQSCHRSQSNKAPSCPLARKDCVKCHMPRETGFMTHSDFADHWIRKLPKDR